MLSLARRWQTHQTQLEWRAVFRDLELRCVDRAGELRIISISGEPMFDAQAEFKGYCGVTRDITARKQVEAAASESDTYARVILDTLASQMCVLDETGTIIMVNAAWRVFAASHRGMVASALQGSNYLTVCDQIIGNERVDAIAMAAGIRQVIFGERELFRYEYFCDAPSGQRWFIASVARIHAGG